MRSAHRWRWGQLAVACSALIAVFLIDLFESLAGGDGWAWLGFVGVPVLICMVPLIVLVGPRRIVLTEEAIRIRDGMRRGGTFVIDRRYVTGVEVLHDPPGWPRSTPHGVPVPNLRVRLTVDAELWVVPDFVLAPRRARPSDRRRLLVGTAVECDARDAAAAYAAILDWIGGGPNGPAVRHEALTRLAVAVRLLRDARPGEPVPSAPVAEGTG